MRKMNMSYAKSYIDKNTNATKTKWINIGNVVITDDGKVFGEIEVIPVGVTELKLTVLTKKTSKQIKLDTSNPNNNNTTQTACQHNI